MDNLTKLKSYRAETRHEFSLLKQRVSWYVTCQSFLVIAFSSGMSNSNAYFRLGIGFILSTLGIITSILIKPSIDGAITIEKLNSRILELEEKVEKLKVSRDKDEQNIIKTTIGRYPQKNREQTAG